MRVYLGVWNSPTPVSDDEAAARFLVLSDEHSAKPAFDSNVYTFYSHLTSIYPEVEMVPEDQLDDCPWACSLDMCGGHVIIPILLEKSDTIVPQVVMLAEQYKLVCFDPQAGKVHLPLHLKEMQAEAAARAACAVEPKPSSPADMQITVLFKFPNLAPEPKKA